MAHKDEYVDHRKNKAGEADAQRHVVQQSGRFAVPLRSDLVAGHVGIAGLKEGVGGGEGKVCG